MLMSIFIKIGHLEKYLCCLNDFQTTLVRYIYVIYMYVYKPKLNNVIYYY